MVFESRFEAYVFKVWAQVSRPGVLIPLFFGAITLADWKDNDRMERQRDKLGMKPDSPRRQPRETGRDDEQARKDELDAQEVEK